MKPNNWNLNVVVIWKNKIDTIDIPCKHVNINIKMNMNMTCNMYFYIYIYMRIYIYICVSVSSHVLFSPGASSEFVVGQ